MGKKPNGHAGEQDQLAPEDEEFEEKPLDEMTTNELLVRLLRITADESLTRSELRQIVEAALRITANRREKPN